MLHSPFATIVLKSFPGGADKYQKTSISLLEFFKNGIVIQKKVIVRVSFSIKERQDSDHIWSNVFIHGGYHEKTQNHYYSYRIHLIIIFDLGFYHAVQFSV